MGVKSKFEPSLSLSLNARAISRAHASSLIKITTDTRELVPPVGPRVARGPALAAARVRRRRRVTAERRRGRKPLGGGGCGANPGRVLRSASIRSCVTAASAPPAARGFTHGAGAAGGGGGAEKAAAARIAAAMRGS